MYSSCYSLNKYHAKKVGIKKADIMARFFEYIMEVTLLFSKISGFFTWIKGSHIIRIIIIDSFYS